MQVDAGRTRELLEGLRADPRLAAQLRMAPVQTIRALSFLSLAEKTALVRLGRDVLSGWKDGGACGCEGTCGGCAGKKPGGCGGGCSGGCTSERAKAPRAEVCAKCKGLRGDCNCADLADTAWAGEAMGGSVPMHVLDARSQKASARPEMATCEGCRKGHGCDGHRASVARAPRGFGVEPTPLHPRGFPSPWDTMRDPLARGATAKPVPFNPASLEVWKDQDLLFQRQVDRFTTQAWSFASFLPPPFDANDIDWKGSPSPHTWAVRYNAGFPNPAYMLQASDKYSGCAREVPMYRRTEAHLFARDADETVQSLWAIPDTTNGWVDEASTVRGGLPPYRLPTDVVVPFEGANTPFERKVLRLRPEHFWTSRIPWEQFWSSPTPVTANIGSWRAPGDEPLGYGSIKAIRHVPHALCEHGEPLQPVVERIVHTIAEKIAKEGCETISLPATSAVLATISPHTVIPSSVSIRSTLRFANAVSFWRTQDNGSPRRVKSGPEDLEVGFLLRMRLLVDPDTFWVVTFLGPVPIPIPVPIDIGTCELAATVEYVFELQDLDGRSASPGVLGVRVGRVAWSDNGATSCGLVKGHVEEMLTTRSDGSAGELVATIQGEGRNKQVFEPSYADRPADRSAWACDPGCYGARDWIVRAVLAGYGRLFGEMPAPALSYVNAVLDPGGAGAGMWRCVIEPRAEFPGQCNPPGDPMCQLLLPARGLIGAPDAVYLQWFDDPWPSWRNLANPAYLLWLATFAADETERDNDGNIVRACPDTTGFYSLCSPARPPLQWVDGPQAYYPAVFSTATAGEPFESAIQCQQASTAPPCPCRYDADCQRPLRCERVGPSDALGRCTKGGYLGGGGGAW